MHGDTRCDAAGPLKSNVKTTDAVLAQCPANGCLDAKENAERRMRARIAADVSTFDRKAGNERRNAADLDHVGNAHADVFRGHITTAQIVDGLAEGVEHFGRLRPLFVGKDHRLAAAERKSGHRVLVAHTARETQRVLQAVSRVSIVPETRPARGRPKWVE